MSPSGTLNLSLPDAINNARDPMQNPGQTRIFYKVGQTRMTRKKVTRMTWITRMT